MLLPNNPARKPKQTCNAAVHVLDCYFAGYDSLLLVGPWNVISKHWPKEYKRAEFSHHTEERPPMLHHSMSRGQFRDCKNYGPKAELTKVPEKSNLNLQTGYSPFILVIF